MESGVTWLLWLCGWWGLWKFAYGEPGPYVLCLSLASHFRIPPPFGQVPPLLDVLMTYLVGHSTFYASTSANRMRVPCKSQSPDECDGSIHSASCVAKDRHLAPVLHPGTQPGLLFFWRLLLHLALASLLAPLLCASGEAAKRVKLRKFQRFRGRPRCARIFSLHFEVSCALLSMRRWRALSQLEWPPQPRPAQPWLTLLHPYLYFFFSEVPGKKPEGPIRLEHIRPSSLEAPIDVWWPGVPAPREGYPVLFLIHGGAWRGGHRRCSPQAPLLQALAAAGFLIVSCEYRRRRGAQLAGVLVGLTVGLLEDCKAALEWLEKDGATLGADLSDVSIAGASAGGHLAALLLATPPQSPWRLCHPLPSCAALLPGPGSSGSQRCDCEVTLLL
eukprot:s8608_g3.t1